MRVNVFRKVNGLTINDDFKQYKSRLLPLKKHSFLDEPEEIQRISNYGGTA
ncbi:hypothetical protein C426_1419 [Lactococcus garvieae DCC43]|uniref:Uncharacterized protein n=1 Tax=Lactococcus garvieae DCC43 TaxID=1231377 RepID=K2QCL7_9LACT|nr:hypothetical protein C426_1419 [Lactococcus garvieae DCC43]